MEKPKKWCLAAAVFAVISMLALAPVYGLPSSKEVDQVVQHKEYVLGFDFETNCALWVSYDLTPDEYKNINAVERKDNFRPDALVAIEHRVVAADYKKSGYDKGHLVPADHFEYSFDAMNDTFFMSNMVPQTHKMNAGQWKAIEADMHDDKAKRATTIYRICGPIFDGKAPVYIGSQHKIRVPSACYSIVYWKENGVWKFECYIVTQENEMRQSSVDEIAKLTKIDFDLLKE